ncbi:TolC family protein [Telmatobacter bradus]|uniref:TolC family protein n=1 Tax=Telmatobacter bradus TaxID=474953 RepID=UPI003B428847
MRFTRPVAFLAALICLTSRSIYGQASGEPELVLTLDEVIHRAEVNEPSYAAATAASHLAKLDRNIARATLLPTVNFHNQGVYTQPIRSSSHTVVSDSSPRFAASNDVREYISQGIVNESFSLGLLGDLRKIDAAAIQAAAEQEIAHRGLVATITDMFFGELATVEHAAIAKRAHDEAADFLNLTQKREQAREAAHADVVKAQLDEQQRARELEDAGLAAENARLQLGVLLFPDPTTPYRLAEEVFPVLSSRTEIEQAAAKNNPEMKSALALVAQSNADVLTARSAYLPTIGINYTYGIDAPQFAVNGSNQTRNLGYSVGMSVDLPVWDWLSTQHKIKQSEIRRDVARVALSATQRQLIARLNEAYAEASVAQHQLASLDSSVSTAEESLRLTRMRYTGGEATVLEVVDAQSALVVAENSREDGRVRYCMAFANLQTLTGKM